MKENFERILKQQLDNYEMPYDNGAWEQFSKRLDGTPPTSFYRKWWFAASVGTVLVGSATYFALSSAENTTPERTAAQQTVAETTGKSEAPSVHKTQTASGQQTTTEQTAGKEQQAPHQEAYNWVSTPDASIGLSQDPQQRVERAGADEHRVVTTPSGPNVPVHNTPHLVKFEAPAMICLNESFTVKNPNDLPITVTMPNGRTKTIAGKQSAEIKASEAGRISLHTNGQTEIVVVNEAVSNLIIDADALVYENGIPTLRFNVLNADHPVTWKSSVNPKEEPAGKNELIVHPFSQNDVTVTAYSTDQNGCTVSEKKTIPGKIYNLLAPTGFNPTSSDERTNKFIPYALKERDTPFEMVIMDAKSMAVVYRTTDASQGWDGIDSRNGQMAAPGSTWLWKVTLKSPNPGEPREYSGLVTTKRVD
jgi:hypothetical protein